MCTLPERPFSDPGLAAERVRGAGRMRPTPRSLEGSGMMASCSRRMPLPSRDRSGEPLFGGICYVQVIP